MQNMEEATALQIVLSEGPLFSVSGRFLNCKHVAAFKVD